MKRRREMEDDILVDATDRISQVPEFIIHHIMSFLKSPKERVRMSVLSKNWFVITASFPILDFDIEKFERVMKFYSSYPSKSDIVRDKFFKYVEYTTYRFCQQNVSAHTFNLVTELLDSTEADLVDRCLGLILKKDVKVLNIDTFFRPRIWTPAIPEYHLPNQLLSASSLTSLKIRACEFPLSLMVDQVRFNSLKLLRLEYLHLDDEAIKYLTCNCPLLEELVVKFCNGFKRFCVFGLQNLQKVEIDCLVEIIDIQAPNLRDVCVTNRGSSEAPSINLASCKKLKNLSYYASSPLKSEVFSGFLSNIPFIENLTLSLPDNCKYLRLLSSSLRTLALLTESDMEEIDIATPNLLLFEYHMHSNLPALVVRDSLQPRARLECYPRDEVDSLWFQKLRQLLDTKTGFEVLKLQIRVDFSGVEELKMIQSPPNELEHIELKLMNIYKLSDYETVLDAVLWCCCPRSLSLKSLFHIIYYSEEWNQVVKYTYEKLLQQEDDGQINIRMVLCSSKAEKHFSDLNSLLTALPCVEQEHVITFIKEEEVECLTKVGLLNKKEKRKSDQFEYVHTMPFKGKKDETSFCG
ncbi:F-box domain, Leucine-rich repeat domain, L domain-like protein [Artemisia annua]|uniref:F-box domain, Leucine-rich repeat domain, L domain-like protein n=1 Tax=Artemisia annua TaxID=35608 RepID=A0A2U1KWU4_ARTAN|nr:F-box domain, Leucine-rich repeat domain, L domain-like protein [Artemisia annua]